MVECFAKNMANKFCHSKSFTWIQHFFLSKSLIIWIPSFPLTAPTPPRSHSSWLLVALITPHTEGTLRAVKAMTPCLCMREDAQSEPILPRRQCEVTVCALFSALDGTGMHFGRGVGQQRPTSIRAWHESQVKELFQASEEHMNVHKSVELHSGFSQRHFGPFGPTSICL